MTDFSEFGAVERRGWADGDVVENWTARFGTLADQAAEVLLQLAEVAAGHELLDLCCGTGALSARAAERGAVVTGVDFSPRMVRQARNRAPGATIVEGDVQAMPFRDGSFDAVISNFGIQHTPDHPRAYAEVVRVLRPGGVFAMSCWDARGPDGAFGLVLDVLKRTAKFSAKPPPQPGLFDFADRDAAASALQRRGLRLLQHRSLPLEWRLDRPEDVFENFARGTVGVRMLIASQSEAAVERIAATLAEEVEARFADTDGGYRVPVPAAVLLAEPR